jgi:hypothetical protein
MRRENADDLAEHHQRQVRNNILLLIQATGMRPPPLDANVTILDLLMNYAETTGRAKISPGEANSRDLGLLRDKAAYCRPVAKAEKMIQDNKNAVSNSEIVRGCQMIPNTPRGTVTMDEYRAVRVLEDGLSYLFGKPEFKHLIAQAEATTEATPIGFQLLHYRSRMNTERQGYDYSTEHQSRLEAANKMKALLCEDITSRRTLTTRSPLSTKPLEMNIVIFS